MVDAAGRVVRSPSPSYSLGEPTRVGALIPLAGLPPGPYTLRARLTDGPNAAARAIGFAVK